MRHKISITIDEDTLLRVREQLRSKVFRNKSHFFEVAANDYLESTEVTK